MDSPFGDAGKTRAGLVLGATLLIGILIGWAASRSADRTHESDRTAAERASAADRQAAGRQSDAAEASKIILGDITRVPFQELYSVLALRSPDELAQISRQLDAMPLGVETSRKITAFFKAWSHQDAKAALASAVTLKTLEARGTAIAAVIDAADVTAIPLVAQTINELPSETLPPDRKRGILGAAATKWSELDPPAAAKFLDAVTAGAGKTFVDRHTIARNWAAVDPAAALAWARESDGAGSQFTFATNGAISGWWDKDPKAAEDYVVAHSTGSNAQFASILASRIANSDPQRAIEWAKQLPDGEARRHANNIIVSQLSWDNPKGTTEWALTLPPEDRGPALSTAMHHWARTDPHAAAEWLNELGDQNRDDAVAAYSYGTSIQDPPAALAWASSITDPAKREKSIGAIYQDWMRRNRDDAQAWVQNSQLPDEQKNRLLALAPEG